MSMNCRGIAEQKKRRDVMHYIRNKNYDIVFLQDTHLTTKTVPYFDNLWRGRNFHSCFTSRSRGTSILFSNRLPYTLISNMNSDCGNFHTVACSINNESFLFVNVYGPNTDNPGFYEELGNNIAKFNVDFIVIAGDLNFVIDPTTDSLNYVGENNIRAKQAFLDLTYKFGLIDAWRVTHPGDRQYSWKRRTPLNAGRLDMFFVSDELLNSLTDVEITPGYRTDHNAVTLSIQRGQRRGSGLWKFNVSHLVDKEYTERVNPRTGMGSRITRPGRGGRICPPCHLGSYES